MSMNKWQRTNKTPSSFSLPPKFKFTSNSRLMPKSPDVSFQEIPCRLYSVDPKINGTIGRKRKIIYKDENGENQSTVSTIRDLKGAVLDVEKKVYKPMAEKINFEYLKQVEKNNAKLKKRGKDLDNLLKKIKYERSLISEQEYETANSERPSEEHGVEDSDDTDEIENSEDTDEIENSEDSSEEGFKYAKSKIGEKIKSQNLKNNVENEPEFISENSENDEQEVESENYKNDEPEFNRSAITSSQLKSPQKRTRLQYQSRSQTNDYKEISPKRPRSRQNQQQITTNHILHIAKQNHSKNVKKQNKPMERKVVMSKWSLRLRLNNAISVTGCREGDEAIYCIWCSTPIVERISAREVRSSSGSVYVLKGQIRITNSLQAGVNRHIVEKFKNGFPLNWKAILNVTPDKTTKSNNTKKQVTSFTTYTKSHSVKSVKCLTKSPPKRATTSNAVKPTQRDDSFGYLLDTSQRNLDFSQSEVQSLELNELPRTKSGRRVIPRLAYWMNQYAKFDTNNNVTIVNPELNLHSLANGSVRKRDEEKANGSVRKRDEEKANGSVRKRDEEKANGSVRKRDEEKANESVRKRDEEKANGSVRKRDEEKANESVRKRDEEKANESVRKRDEEKANGSVRKRDEEKENNKSNVRQRKVKKTKIAKTIRKRDEKENNKSNARQRKVKETKSSKKTKTTKTSTDEKSTHKMLLRNKTHNSPVKSLEIGMKLSEKTNLTSKRTAKTNLTSKRTAKTNLTSKRTAKLSPKKPFKKSYQPVVKVKNILANAEDLVRVTRSTFKIKENNPSNIAHSPKPAAEQNESRDIETGSNGIQNRFRGTYKTKSKSRDSNLRQTQLMRKPESGRGKVVEEISTENLNDKKQVQKNSKKENNLKEKNDGEHIQKKNSKKENNLKENNDGEQIQKKNSKKEENLKEKLDGEQIQKKNNKKENNLKEKNDGEQIQKKNNKKENNSKEKNDGDQIQTKKSKKESNLKVKNDVPELTARPGTLARKRQIFEIFNHQSSNYEADLFNALPLRNHIFVKDLQIFQEANDEKSDSSSSTVCTTPKTNIVQLTPSSRHQTPEVEFPFTFENEVNRKEVDSYIHNRKKKGQGPPLHKKHGPKNVDTDEIGFSSERSDSNFDRLKHSLVSLLKSNKSKDDNFVDEEEEDYYFD